MDRVSPQTVRGDFAKSRFTHAGETFQFSREDEAYSVSVTRPGEPPRTFPIRYTFGISPLQQYLVDVGQGRLQALSVAWDTRDKTEGGQRWFHLHAGDRLAPGHRLHWESAAYTWNSRCADCHSTAVVRGYRPASDSYETEYSSIDVSCEACHGAASRHVAWARKKAAGRVDPLPNGGFSASLLAPKERRWVLGDGANIAHLVGGLAASAELDACAPCHSRRSDLGPGLGNDFHDRYRLALLGDPLYFPDGQIKEEVFEYGSFLQSKMHLRGVSCSDCHDPHSLELRAKGNTLCGTCHRPSHYDAAAHHFHPAGTPASECVTCHMPATTYMVVDPRRDHRFGVPNPALSKKVGSPDVCTGCHTDRTHAWAQAAIVQRRRGAAPAPSTPGDALWLAREGQLGAPQALKAIASATQLAPIIRASALEALGSYPSPSMSQLVGALGKDAHPLVRRAAASAAASLPPEQLSRLIAPLLGDAVRSVRIEAASSFLGPAASMLAGDDRDKLQRALAEYAAVREYDAASAEGLVDLADLARRSGDRDEAKRLLERAIAKDASFSPAHLNLADLYRERSDSERSVRALEAGLKHAEDTAMLEHALGLALIRAKRHPQGLKHLHAAYRASPERVRFGYVYAVALFDSGRQRDALQVLEELHARRPGDASVLSVLVDYCQRMGLPDEARRYTERLEALSD